MIHGDIEALVRHNVEQANEGGNDDSIHFFKRMRDLADKRLSGTTITTFENRMLDELAKQRSEFARYLEGGIKIINSASMFNRLEQLKVLQKQYSEAQLKRRLSKGFFLEGSDYRSKEDKHIEALGNHLRRLHILAQEDSKKSAAALHQAAEERRVDDWRRLREDHILHENILNAFRKEAEEAEIYEAPEPREAAISRKRQMDARRAERAQQSIQRMGKRDYS